jgi:autotransporter-associated beta strand protein
MQTIKALRASLFFGLSLIAMASAQAQLATWTGASGGEWNTAANWNIGVPGPGTNAVINPSTTVNYNLPMLASSFGILTNNGVLNLNTNGFNTASIFMLNYGSSTSNGRLLINTGAVVNVSGNLALCSNSIVSVSVGSTLAIGGTLIIGSDTTGGTAGTGTPNAYGSFTNFGGAFTAAAVNLNPRNQSVSTSCRLVIAGGTNNLGAVTAARSPGGANTPPALGSDGIVISNGVVYTTSVSVGNNDDGIFYQVGGIVTNTGTFTLKNSTAQRPARFLQTSGLFVTTDPSVVQLDPTGGDVVYSVQGGTNVIGGIQLGSSGATGTNYFTNSAAIYVGSQGIVSNGAAVLITSLNNGASFGATANWTESAAMRLSSGIFTFNTADFSGIGHTITWYGVLSGAGGLLVTNDGIFALASTNTFAGNTTIAPGADLQLGDGSVANGTVAGLITNNGVLTVANPYSQIITTNILGSGSLVETGPGTLILGTNNYTGGTIISSGTLQLGDGATFDGLVPGPITDNGTLAVANPTAQTLTTAISGSGSFVKSGAGFLTLNANETYAGSTTVNGGALVLGASGLLHSTQNVTIASGALLDVSAAGVSSPGVYTLGSGYVFSAGHTAGTGPDFNGWLINNGSVNVPTASTLTIGGGSFPKGALSLQNGGTVVFNVGSSPSGGSTIALGGGPLYLTGTSTIQINFGVLGVGTYPLISGAGSVSGGLANLTLALNGTLGVYQANLQVTATGLNLVVTGNPHNLVWQGDGSANSWDNNPANLDWVNTATHAADYFVAGYFVTFDNTGAANQPTLNASVSPAWTTINGSANYTFSGGGYINSGSLTNNSTGTVYVQTPNTYNGGTVINAGTVEVDNGGALGTGPVLNNSALNFNNTYSTTPNVIKGSGSVTLISGTTTLAAANTYAGGTTIASGTLQLGAANAIPGGLVAGDVNNSGTLDLATYSDTINALSGGGTVDTIEGGAPTLTVGANGDSGTFSGIIQNSSGTLNLAKTGSGVEVLANANTYAGTTTIANGTLGLAANNALPVTTTVTLGGSGTTGILDLGGNSQQLAGLTAGAGALGTNQIIGNSSTTSPATLIINTSGTVTYGGAILDVLGAGTETVGVTLNSGALTLDGTNEYTGNTIDNGAAGGNTLLSVTGGFLSASNLTVNSANGSRGFLLSGGVASFSGNVFFSADNGNYGNYFAVTGGILNAGSLSEGRCNLALTTQPATGQATTEGIYVNGGAVTVTNNLLVGGANSGGNSSSSFRVDTGSVTVGGTTIVTLNNGSRWSVLDIAGGTFTSTAATGPGIQLGGVYAGANDVFLIRAGTVNADTITLGDTNQTSGTDALSLTGGTLYLGAGGLVLGNASPTYTSTISLGTGTVGALTNWSTSLPLNLSGTTTFQAASASSNAFNITLNGVLSGAATLNKTGAGTLTLNAAETYSGGTLINAGTLALGSAGSLASLNLLVATNATLDVSQVAAGYTLNASQTLKGFGSVNGLVSAASGSAIYPGSNALTGTLTFNTGLTESGGVANTYNLSSTPGGPTNDLIIVTGTLTASGVNTVLINGTVQAGAAYPLFSYGTFTGTTANFNVTGASGVISNSPSAHTIYFVAQTSVRAPTNITWLGNLTVNNWDTEITTNWLNNGTGLLDIFVPGDSVLFGSQGEVHPVVNLAGTVTPAGITVTTNYTFTGTGSIGGGGGLTVSNGTLTVLTTNNYTGPTVINGALVTSSLAPSGAPSGIGSATADPGNLIINGGTLGYTGLSATTDHGITLTNTGGTFDVTVGAVLALNGALTGGGSLTKTDSGTLILGTANTYTGSNIIAGGVLQIASAASVSAASITFSNGTLAYSPSAGLTVANALDFIPGTTNMIIATSGSGGNPISSGTWTGSGVILVSNTYNPFTVNGVLDGFTGTISLATPNGASFRFNSGGGNTSFGSLNATFDLGTNNANLFCRNAATINLGALEGGVNTTVSGQSSDAGTATWSIGNNNLSTTFAGVIKNDAANQLSAVTKVGTGTLTLEGLNTYSGPTTISSGVLALAYNATNGTDGAIENSTPIQFAAGTVLDVSRTSIGTFPLGGGQTLVGPGLIRGSLDASGTLTPGGTLTVTNVLTLEGSSTVNLNLNTAASPNSDRIVAGNSIVNNGATLIVNNNGPAMQTGQTFTLFSSPVANNTFSSITLPPLTGSQYWNTSNLALDGTISVAVPAPLSFSGITTSGSDILLNAQGGTPGGAVTVLTSTNLTLPLAQWTTVTTGNFDGNGNFNYTVSGALTSGLKQQFYQLVQ